MTANMVTLEQQVAAESCCGTLAWCMFSQLQSEIVAWESSVDVLNCKPVPETRSCLFNSFLTLRIGRVKVC